MIKRIFKSWPSRVLAMLVLGVLIIFVMEKLDNRVYVGEIPETEIPLALNGDLVLARTGRTYLVHDARDGTTTPLPQPDMPSKTYRDEPVCASGDQIALERTTPITIADWGDVGIEFTNVIDWFQWSASDLVLTATHMGSAIGDLVLDPWTCAVMPESTSFSFRLEGEGPETERLLVLSGGGFKWWATVSEDPDTTVLDKRFWERTMSAVPAAEPNRFLTWQEANSQLMVQRQGQSKEEIPARNAFWAVLDLKDAVALKVDVPKRRWTSNPMHDTDTLRCMSCGCDCFRDYDYNLSGNHIFAVLTGELMFVRDAGIHRLDLRATEKGWVHVLPAALNRPVILSPGGCRAAISDGKVRIVDLCD